MASKAALILIIAAAALGLLASDRLLELLTNTALLAAGTLCVALPLGSLLGLFIAKTDLPGRRVATWLCAGLLFIPLYVQAAAWNTVIGPGGWLSQVLTESDHTNPWLSGWRAVVWIHAMGAVPWAALLTAASLRTVERRLEEESLLDASPQRVLWRVSLRRGAGGVWAAAVWITIVCATEIAVTDLYQIRTFAEEIYTQASLGPLSAGGLLTTDLAVGTALIALLVVLALWLVTSWLPSVATIAADATWKWRPARGRLVLAAVIWAIVVLATCAPLAGLAWKAGVKVDQVDGDYVRSWSLAKAVSMVLESPWEHRREWGWSFMIGGISAAAATTLAIAAAWLARIRPVVRTPLGAMIAFGLAVPAPLLGVWVIALLNRPADSPLASLATLYDRTLFAPVLVQLVRAAPLVSLWLWSQLASVPRDLLEAARSEGAGPIMQLFRIALPLRLTGVLAALLASFVLSVGELSATLLVVPPGVTTISVRVFQLLHYGVDDRVAALSLSIFAGLGAVAFLTGQAYHRIRSAALRDAPEPLPG